MIELSIDDAGLTALERALVTMHQDQIPYAMARALNDCTAAAAKSVNAAMSETFDRPTGFTSRAAIAPRALAASKANLAATVTLRPIQAQYLALEETGGTRTGAMNTGTPSKTIMLPGKILNLNSFGNIPKGTLPRWKAQATPVGRRGRGHASGRAPSIAFLPASAPGNLAKISGWFRRLGKGHLARLSAFEKTTTYKPRLGYHERVEAVVRATWPVAMLARLHGAIRSAR